MRQVWENLIDNWQIFLSEPAVQDEEEAEEQAQPVQDEEQVQPEEDEEQTDNSE